MDFPSFITQLHPLLLILFQVLSSTLTVGHTSASSLWRLLVLPLQLMFMYSVVFGSANYMRPFWASLVGGLSAVLLLQFFDLNLLSRWSFRHSGPMEGTSSQKSHGEGLETMNDTFWNRFLWGFNVNCAFRHISTPQESKNCQHFRPHDPQYSPSRPIFLARSLLIIICAYVTMDMFSTQPPPPDPATLFGPSRIRFFTRLGDLTAEEMVLRAVVTFAGFLNSYCLITGIQLLMGFFLVGLGVSEPRFWRPQFGSLSDSYSVRRFWGSFWHQNLRRMLTEPSKFFARRILCLPNNGLLQRYIKILVTFYLSGAVHAIADVAGGIISWRDQLTVKFFVMQTLGIIIEDVVAAVYRATRGKKRTPGPPGLWIRRVGYVWVAGFLVWSTPMWMYPGASRATGVTRSILPYSLINMEWT